MEELADSKLVSDSKSSSDGYGAPHSSTSSGAEEEGDAEGISQWHAQHWESFRPAWSDNSGADASDEGTCRGENSPELDRENVSLDVPLKQSNLPSTTQVRRLDMHSDQRVKRPDKTAFRGTKPLQGNRQGNLEESGTNRAIPLRQDLPKKTDTREMCSSNVSKIKTKSPNPANYSILQSNASSTRYTGQFAAGRSRSSFQITSVSGKARTASNKGGSGGSNGGGDFGPGLGSSGPPAYSGSFKQNALSSLNESGAGYLRGVGAMQAKVQPIEGKRKAGKPKGVPHPGGLTQPKGVPHSGAPTPLSPPLCYANGTEIFNIEFIDSQCERHEEAILRLDLKRMNLDAKIAKRKSQNSQPSVSGIPSIRKHP